MKKTSEKQVTKKEKTCEECKRLQNELFEADTMLNNLNAAVEAEKIQVEKLEERITTIIGVYSDIIDTLIRQLKKEVQIRIEQKERWDRYYNSRRYPDDECQKCGEDMKKCICKTGDV
jgi:chromosome segregation ATPase